MSVIAVSLKKKISKRWKVFTLFHVPSRVALTILACSRRTLRWTFCQSMACQSVTPWKDAPAASTSGFSVVEGSAVICFSSSVVYSSILVTKDLAEVCPLSREVMLQPLSFPLQDGIRFLRFPLPAISSAYLAAAYRERKISGLPCFARVTEWVRSALSAGGVGCPREGHQT